MRSHQRPRAASLIRGGRRDLRAWTPTFWQRASLVTGGTSGALGVCAGTARMFSTVSFGTELCLCASSVLCAVIAAAVAIAGITANRPPEVRKSGA
jgi:hypothetical protein